MTQTLAIVLAAGKGTRMKSDLPKVLIPVLGRPMIEYVLDTLDTAGIDQTVVVVGYRAELVRELVERRPRVRTALQAEQLGTGHAVMMCRQALAAHDGPVLIVAGDSPMLTARSVGALLDEYQRTRPACLLGTAHKDNPQGLGRVVRDAAGKFVGIVEEKDATPEQRQITEVNLSCYVFDSRALLATLDQLKADNAQREYYLTDCPGLLQRAGQAVEARAVLTAREALSINTVDELRVVEEALRGAS
ncbi:MAG: NTP transferase domain-containing protein [Planctomycetes bacterium]|nr:NTP transferase domain-containing protein [Planctomycetota bacterium]